MELETFRPGGGNPEIYVSLSPPLPRSIGLAKSEEICGKYEGM